MNGHATSNSLKSEGLSLADLPKSNTFTSSIPGDAMFPTPESSYSAPRAKLGPRMVKNALYTFVRPEEKEEPELVGVSYPAMRDIGLKAGEENTTDFKALVAGNKIMWEPSKPKEGIYPWAQCYGGWQFGSWAGQLGDGRAISLFESTNPDTRTRYEIQLKGAGKTPYSRFADGRAVVRSSVREFVVSEALNGLGIPTTRALSLTLTPKTKVQRERTELGAVVCRFAQTWLRIGTFDILRARGDRALIRKLADYLQEHVFTDHRLPSDAFSPSDKSASASASDETPQNATRHEALYLNRYAQLYRHVCQLNAKTVAAWQAYGFTNGVLNTDNTSLLGLSLDFGPFAFLDDFDPTFTPNHDDHQLRYSYRNQPSVIWWNLTRLGESLGELLGAGSWVDHEEFRERGVKEEQMEEVVQRAEGIIAAAGEEYRRVFLEEYKRLMSRRLGLKSDKQSDFEELFSEALDSLHAFELDFSHFFRRLSNITAEEMKSEESRRDVAGRFFHTEGMSAAGQTEEEARTRLGKWLGAYRTRVVQDWGESREADGERMAAMRAVNPKFVARGWVLDEIIKRVQDKGDREVLAHVMRMVEDPFREEWGGDRGEEERWCGEVPKIGRGIMCSCSS